jgi:hypothetical protein
MTKVLWDFDATKYLFASVCEKRSVDVLHKPSGKVKNFPSRTDFHGHWKKKEGGWLAEVNLERQMNNKPPFSAEEFEFTDIQKPEPIEFILSSIKSHIKTINEKLGATSYYGYVGKGDSFRVEKSTIVKYKANREDSLRPLMLDEVEKYLITYHGAKIVRGIEADDQIVIDCTNDPNIVLVGIDKDYRGCDLNFYIHDSMDKPEWMGGFGRLYLNTKGEVKGNGYLWWLFQVLSSDAADNYAANSACPEKKWGPKSAYKLLEPCKNEKEAWQAVIKGYNTLYPEPKEIVGWRGDKIVVDAKYVLNENCIMSKMMTSEDYKFNLDEELDKYGLKMESEIK